MSTNTKEQPNLLLIILLLSILLLVNCLTASAQTTLLSEDFEGGAASWTLTTNSGNGNNYWQVSNGSCSNGSNLLMVRRNTDPCVYRNNRAHNLTASRQVDSRGYQNLTLDFDWICNGEANYDFGSVYYSFNGSTWTLLTVGGNAGIYQGTTSWTSETAIALPAELNDTVFYIGFNWINDASVGTSPAFGIDNIVVKGSVIPIVPPTPPTIGIFSENFSSGALPSGWSSIDNTGNNAGTWSFNNPGNRTINTASSANGFAIFDSDALGQDNKVENAELETVAFDCSDYDIVNLSLEHYFRHYANSDYRISISGDNGDTYNTLVFDSADTDNAATFSANISSFAAGRSQVKLKFSYHGHYSWYWAIDDIVVDGLSADSAAWTGAVSTDWSVAGNWSGNNIPTVATAVLIPSSAVRMPTVASDAGAGCFNLTIESGATLTIETDSTQGGNLNITGNLICDGAIEHTGSAFVRLSGAGKFISGDFTSGSNNRQWQFEDGSSYLLNGDLITYGVRINPGASLELNGHDLSVYLFQQFGSFNLGASTLEIGGDNTIITEAEFNPGTGMVMFNSGGSAWAAKGTVNQSVPSASYYEVYVRTNNGFTTTVGSSGTLMVATDMIIENPGTAGGIATTGSAIQVAGNLSLGDVGNNGFTFNVGHRISGGGSTSSIVFDGGATDNQVNITFTDASLAAFGNFDATSSFDYPIAYTGAGTQMVLPGTYNNLSINGSGTKALGGDVTVDGNLQLISGTLSSAISMVVEKISTDSPVAVNYLNGGVAANNDVPTLASLIANASSMSVTVPAAYTSYSIVGCGVNIPHTYNADLDIYLVSPSGTVYTVSTDNGGNGAGYIDTKFSDAGTATYPNNSVITGTYQPEGFTFASIPDAANGVWTIYVVDDADQDVGTLTAFNIQLRSTATDADITLNGNWVNTGATFTANSGLVTFSGSSQQSITSNSQSFNQVLINNPAGVLLTDDATISNILTLTQGVVSTGGSRVILTNTSAGNLTGFSNTSFINGNLRRYIGFNTQTYAFPVGNGTSAANYHLAELTNNLLTGVTYLDASFGALTGHNDTELNVSESGVSFSRINPAGVWTIEPNAQPILGSYGIRLHTNGFNGLVDNEFVVLKRPVGSTSGADWSTGGGLLNILGGLGRLVSDGFALRTGLTSFSEFGVGDGSSGGASLPIELLSFTATLNDRAEVELDWATALEIENDYFTVERSADGIDFEPVLEVNGAGNTSIMQTYSAIDANPLAGLSYYRLKQTDFDGTFTYSKLEAVNVFKAEMDATMTVYPNPSNGNIKVKATGVKGMVSIMVTDMQGRNIYLQHLRIEEDEVPVSLNLESMLSPGYYQVIMKGSNINLVEKIIIQ